MTVINASFYFDFSDPASYLAALQLPDFVERYPVELELCPVDGMSLASRAGSGEVSRMMAHYRQQDYQRWARQLGVDLVLPDQPVNQGLALRVGHWLVENTEDEALPAVLALFDQIASTGVVMDENAVRECLDQLGLASGAALESARDIDAYRGIDQTLERAHAQGIFVVPTLVVDGQRFVGYDRFDFARQAVVERVVREAPLDKLAPAMAQLITSLSPQRARQLLASLGAVPAGEEEQPFLTEEGESGFDQLSVTIRVLPQPALEQRLPVAPPGDLKFRVHRLLDTEDLSIDGKSLADMISGKGASVCGPDPLLVADVGAVRDKLKANRQLQTGGLLSAAVVGGVDALLMAGPRTRKSDDSVHLSTSPPGPAPDGEIVASVVSGGKAAFLSGVLAMDAVAHRKASAAGAHVLFLATREDVSITARASAIRCQRWVVVIGPEDVLVYDQEGAEQKTEWADDAVVELTLSWPPVFPELAPAPPPPPRTMLVNEEPVTLGPIDSPADVGFTVTGNGLLVSTAGVRSMLAANRRFESVRHPSGPILVLPIYGNSVMRPEAVTHKVLNTLSRCPSDGQILLVNYWSELPYERLEELHPILAATAAEQAAPVLLVVGARPVDLWAADTSTGLNAYRVEADGEEFPLDLAQQISIPDRKRFFLDRMGHNPERYLQMLQTMTPRT